MAFTNYDVFSYFINVGVGDCGVHLLLDKGTNAIVSSVIIDGGRPAARDAVRQGIAHIAAELRTAFRFSAVVVSHWDDDHYGGLIKLLYDDWEDRGRLLPSTYLTEQTVFYCPWRSIESELNIKKKRMRVVVDPQDDTCQILQFRNSDNGLWMTICPAVPSTYALGYDLFFNQHYETGSYYIGKPPNKHWPVTVEDVYTRCAELSTFSRPIFLVYGIDNNRLDLNPWTEKQEKWKMTPLKDKDIKNESSVMALVFWPRDPNQNNGPFRVSLFTGGDVHHWQEMQLLEWLDEAQVEYSLDVVKASHHGSHASTPELMLLNGVQYLVISAGDAHGHPSFALVYCTLALVNAFLTRQPGSYPRILATRIPYWLIWQTHRLSTTACNIGTIFGWEDTAISVQENFKYIDGRLRTNSFLTDYLESNFRYTIEQAKKGWCKEKKQSYCKRKRKAHPKHPMSSRPYPPHEAELPDTAAEYFGAGLAEMQKELKLMWELYCSPNIDVARGVQWTKTVARGDNPLVEFEQSTISDQLLTDIRKAVGIWEAVDDLEWALRLKDAAAITMKGSVNLNPATNAAPPGMDEERDNITKAASVLPPGFPSIEDWVFSLFVGALKTSQSPFADNFDRWLTGAESVLVRWFGDHLETSKAALRLVGFKSGTESETVIRQVDLRVQLKEPSAGQASSAFVFTTQRAACRQQFGLEAEQQLSSRGYSSTLCGIILALDDKQVDRSMSLTVPQFAAMFRFPLPSGPKPLSLLNKIKLVPCVGENDRPPRSGLWFMPMFNTRTITRLAMQLSEDTIGSESLRELFNAGFGPVSFTDVLFVGVRVTESGGLRGTSSSTKISMQCSMQWDDTHGNKPPDFSGRAVISMTGSGAELTLKFENSTNLLGQLLKWAQRLFTSRADGKGQPVFTILDSDDLAARISASLSAVTSSLHFYTHRISISLDKDMMPRSFQIDVEVAMALSAEQHTPFLATISWENGGVQVSAKLWSKQSFAPVTPQELHPFYERSAICMPRSPNPVYHIPLKTLLRLPKDAKIPPGLPNAVTSASLDLYYSSTSGGFTASFSTNLECISLGDMDVADSAATPALALERVFVLVDAEYRPTTPSPALTIVFYAALTLNLPPRSDSNSDLADLTPSFVPVSFRIAYSYENKKSSWTASGSVSNLSIGNLFALFAKDGSNYAILDIMGKVTIVDAQLTHQYQSESGTALDIRAQLRLGSITSGINLILDYSHSGDHWSFNATVSPAAEDRIVKVIDFLGDLVPDPSQLPELARNLELPLSRIKGSLVCTKIKDTRGASHVVFGLTISIAGVCISVAQIQSNAAAKAQAFSESDNAGPGRMVRITMTQFPEIPSMPIIGAVDQPFDQLGVVWTSREITPDEIGLLNTFVFKEAPLLSRRTNTDVAPLLKGLHFQVALLASGQNNLVLDHVVQKKQTSKRVTTASSDRVPRPEKTDKGEMVDDDSSALTGGRTVAPMAKKCGPLSVSNIGLSVSGTSMSSISVALDAMLTVGPMSMALIGLTFTIDFSKVKSLEDLASMTFKPNVDGMSLAFVKPPTRFAGLFMKFDNAAEEGFMGTIAVSMTKFTAVANGMYAESKNADHTKTMFVFGVLRGPIFSTGSFEVNGLTGGFGYNSRLALPEVSEVSNFPFIKMNNNLAPPRDLSTELASLRSGDGQRPWISTARDEMWLVAGVSLKAFQTIDAQVLLALTLSSQPKFAILSQATAVFPKSSSSDSSDKALLLLDMVLVAEIDPLHGSIVCAGQFTPRSFILNPSCHLTGGFAFAVFLAGSPFEGDYIFTIGGYARQYAPPAHYPVSPPRVKIIWQYDSQISISGEAYFAISPQVAMGGGRLDMVVDKGWVRVLFSAWADFFIHLHPFDFLAIVGITLTAEVRLPARLFTIHLGPLEFSAQLTLFGPPLSGQASLRLWIYNVTVAFGPSKSPPQPLEWREFVRMTKSLPTSKPLGQEDEVRIPDHVVHITKGIVSDSHRSSKGEHESQQSDSETVIEIRGTHLEFRVQTRVPLLSAEVSGTDVPIDRTNPLFFRPMQLPGSINTSAMSVNLHDGSRVSIPLTAQPIPQNVAPALFGRFEGGTHATAATAKEALITHTMELIVSVQSQTLSREIQVQNQIPVLDVRAWNSVDVGGPRENRIGLEEKPADKGVGGIILRKGTETGPRGLAQMRRGDDERNEDQKQLLGNVLRLLGHRSPEFRACYNKF
ncbi:hypothetical protein F5X97DRAFT_75535 [Nemania serpens]|nr:hypothetical protein F5X97DRAFT_75535 [Nemania serpens]